MSTQILSNAQIGEALVVQHVQERPDAPDWRAWLEEIGFLPGERVSLLARAMPGGDPLVVRVGHSTFALRCAEAACIAVTPA